MPTHDKLTNVSVAAPSQGLGELAAKIHQAIERRAYELYLSRGRENGHGLDDWQRAESELLRSSPEDVTESIYGNVKLRVELPGFSPEEIEVGVEPNRVIVWAQKGRRGATWPAQEAEAKNEPSRVLHSEDLPRPDAWPVQEAEAESESYQVLRIYDLPRPVDPVKARASFTDPILTVEAPRASSASNSAGAHA